MIIIISSISIILIVYAVRFDACLEHRACKNKQNIPEHTNYNACQLSSSTDGLSLTDVSGFKDPLIVIKGSTSFRNLLDDSIKIKIVCAHCHSLQRL